MKKIIATVLAMVMALALCTTAFAAVKYTAYDKKGDKIGTDVTYDSVKASYSKKTGAGNVAYYDVDGFGTYVAAADAKTYDLKLTTPGKAPLYLVTCEDPTYVAKATVFKAVGEDCGQLDVEAISAYTVEDNTFYSYTNDDDEVYYWVADDDNGTENVMVGDKLVKVYFLGKDLALNAHTWEASKYDAKDNATQYTCKDCKTVATVYPSVDAATAAGMKTTAVINGDIIGFNFTAKGATTNSTSGSSSSPKTFDAGIAMYAGMALMSVAGSAVVIGKKKEF